MDILYCGDKNVEEGLFISILTLLKNTKRRLNIWVLTMSCGGPKPVEAMRESFIRNVEVEMKQVNPDNTLKLIDISEMVKQELPKKNMGTRFTPCCMLRLYADRIPELPDKILYLDTDVLARRNFDELYDTNIKDNELAGVLDNYGAHFFRGEGLLDKDYLNSGVLLMNLKLIRKTGMLRKCREMIRTKKMFMPDQSALNKVCKTKRILPRKFNEQKEMREDTVMRHFTTTVHFIPMLKVQTIKPWHVEKVHETLKTYDFDETLGYYIANIDRMKHDVVPVFYSIGESYAPLAAVSIRSLLDNASRRYNYRIWVIHDGLKRGTQKKLAALAEGYSNVDIQFRSVQQTIDAVPKNYLLNMTYFTLTIYFRLFLAEMFPEFNKGIYIDADTVVLGDISKLYEEKLGGNLFGAVADVTVAEIPEFAEYVEKHVGVNRHKYVNSGVLVMNMQRLRELDFGKHCLNLLSRYGFETIAPDQDYINSICRDKMKLIDRKWNMVPMGEIISKPCLVHFNLFNKPWSRSGIPYEEFFWKYVANTPFAKEILKRKRKYTDEMREKDQESLRRMTEKAQEICVVKEPSFAKTKGVKL